MRRLATILGLLLALTAVGAVGIHGTTGRPWLESAYLAVITLTTLGSRDVPEQGETGAMLFIMAYLLGGLGIVSYGAFQLGQNIVNAQFRGVWEQRRMHKAIAALSEHYVVCGQGRMGRAICEFLAQRRRPFVVIERDKERLDHVARPRGWLYVEGDATSDEVLRAAGIERAAALATALPTDADNVYVVMSAHLLAPQLYIVARASDDSAVVKLQRAGATRIISPIRAAGVKMARFMLTPNIEDFLDITDEHGSDLELVELEVSPESPYVGKMLAETDLRSRNLLVVGLRRRAGTSIMAPAPTTRVEAGDALFVFGRRETVNAIVEPSAAPPRR